MIEKIDKKYKVSIKTIKAYDNIQQLKKRYGVLDSTYTVKNKKISKQFGKLPEKRYKSTGRFTAKSTS